MAVFCTNPLFCKGTWFGAVQLKPDQLTRVAEMMVGKTIVCRSGEVRVYYFPVLVLPSSLNLNSQVQHDN